MPMLKIAFDLGVQLAREEAGLAKQADDPMANLVEKLRNIEWPWQKEEPSAFSTWKPYAAGAAAGLGAYGLLRHKFLADPAKYPVLRRIQEMTGGEMQRFGIEGAPDSPGLRTRLKRGITYGPEVFSGDAPKEKLWPRIKEVFTGGEEASGEGAGKASKSNLWDRIKNVFTPEEEASGAGQGIPQEIFEGHRRAPKAVFWGQNPEAMPPGTFDPSLGPYATKAEMEQAFEESQRLLNDKWKQYKEIEKYAPGAMPQTFNVSDVLKAEGINARSGPHMRENLGALQKSLSELFEGKEYILKTRRPRVGGDPPGQSNLGSFPTGETDLAKAHREWMQIRPEVRKAMASNTGPATDVVRQYRNEPAYVGRIVDEILHGNVIAQEKVPIRKYTGATAERMRTKGYSPTEEYRVHAVGGHAPSSLASPRFDAGMKNIIRGKMRSSEASDFMQQDVLNRLPPNHPMARMMLAADVAPVEAAAGGGHKIIEINPGGQSGLAEKPLLSHAMYREMTGHWPVPVAAAGGVGAAAAGTGLGGAAMNMAQDN